MGEARPLVACAVLTDFDRRSCHLVQCEKNKKNKCSENKLLELIGDDCAGKFTKKMANESAGNIHKHAGTMSDLFFCDFTFRTHYVCLIGAIYQMHKGNLIRMSMSKHDDALRMNICTKNLSEL